MEIDFTLTPLKCYSNSLATLFDKKKHYFCLVLLVSIIYIINTILNFTTIQ